MVAVDVSLADLDINQCPTEGDVNKIFGNTAKCHYETQHVRDIIFLHLTRLSNYYMPPDVNDGAICFPELSAVERMSMRDSFLFA